MSDIYDYIKDNPDTSIKQISHYLEMTEDKIRKDIRRLGDKIIRGPGRPAGFTVNPEFDIENEMTETKEEVDIEELEEAIKKDKPKRKILTSQAQLNKMVDEFQVQGIAMGYCRQSRYWKFSKKGKFIIQVKSKELLDIRSNMATFLEENFK